MRTSNTAEISKGSTGDALQSCLKSRINEDTHAVQINMPAIFTKSNLLETSVGRQMHFNLYVGSLIEILIDRLLDYGCFTIKILN